MLSHAATNALASLNHLCSDLFVHGMYAAYPTLYHVLMFSCVDIRPHSAVTEYRTVYAMALPGDPGGMVVRIKRIVEPVLVLAHQPSRATSAPPKKRKRTHKASRAKSKTKSQKKSTSKSATKPDAEGESSPGSKPQVGEFCSLLFLFLFLDTTCHIQIGKQIETKKGGWYNLIICIMRVWFGKSR